MVSFGSKYETLFPNPVEYDQENVDNAVARISTMDSDLGGTELLQPIEWIFENCQK